MINGWYIFGATLLTVNLLWGQKAPRKESTEVEDIETAEQGFLAELAIHSSPKGKDLCLKKSVACVGPDRGEMALSLIAARSSRASLIALAGLVRFKVDGAYGEEYESYVMDKRKAIRGILLSLHPDELHARCLREFSDLARSYKSALEGVREEMVCEDSTAIQERIRDLSEATLHEKGSDR